MLDMKRKPLPRKSPSSKEVKFCMRCADKGAETQVIDISNQYYCVRCGPVDHVIGGYMSSLAVKRANIEITESRLVAERDNILNSAILPKGMPNEQREGGAMALAFCRVALGLEPLAGEVTLGHFGDNHYKVIIQYNGWAALAIYNARNEGIDIDWDDAEPMTKEEIAAHGALDCYKCQGKGNRKSYGKMEKCDTCQGRGKFDPEEVYGAKVRLYDLNAAKKRHEAGLEYAGIVGVGFRQPGMSYPTGRSKQWKADVTAFRDAVRKRFSVGAISIPYGGGGTVSFMGDDEYAPEVKDPRREEFDTWTTERDPDIPEPDALFREVIIPLVHEDVFGSVTDLMDAMLDSGVLNQWYEAPKPKQTSDRLKGVKDGYYPLNLADGDGPIETDEARLLFYDLQDKGDNLIDLWKEVFDKPFPASAGMSVDRVQAYNLVNAYLPERTEEIAELVRAAKGRLLSKEEEKNG